jgi:hypothetical protein
VAVEFAACWIRSTVVPANAGTTEYLNARFSSRSSGRGKTRSAIHTTAEEEMSWNAATF